MDSYRGWKRSSARLATMLSLGVAILMAVGCHTAEGVKQDTKSALDATGKGLQKGASKISGPEKSGAKKDANNDNQAPN
jgi:hypothetical protein